MPDTSSVAKNPRPPNAPWNGALPARLPHGVLAGAELLRAEVFCQDELVAHARSLGEWHQVSGKGARNSLLKRLSANAQRLDEVLSALRAKPVQHSPAAEWLLDNHHLVQEQIATIRRHLPSGYSRELPRLVSGEPAGVPRVYAVAIELISHTDSRVDVDTLEPFIASYQQSSPLMLGELWAVPTMLRLALVENIRRIAVRIHDQELGRHEAGRWAERLIRTAEDGPSGLVVILGQLAQVLRLEPPFIAELQRRLQGQHPALGMALQWLEQRVVELGSSVAGLVHADHQAQASDRLAVENAITSLRRMSMVEWRGFVERMSPMEAVLRGDPSGVYPAMDFASRDCFRQEVERLARGCRRLVPGAGRELEVARTAIDLAANASAGVAPTRHVGWWLIGEGRAQLEAELRRRAGFHGPASRYGKAPVFALTVPIAVLSAIGAAAAGLAILGFAGGPVLAACATALAVLPASRAASALINHLATRAVPPRRIPRLEFADGITAAHATLVAMPVLLRRIEDVREHVDSLLVHALANRDPHLTFVLISDYSDAEAEAMPGDGMVAAAASAAIESINRTYGRRFVFLHRPRRWNPAQGVWMGWERKRGKLADLNRFVLEGDGSAFAVVAGAHERLASARYAIVLDADTRLPRDAARELVGAIAHPLNRPRHDPVTGVVVGGYGILQPRVAISLPSSRRSLFAVWWSGEAGIDPYTQTVSDVYQDLFDAGSFIGKGIYDIEAFERATRGRFPHDSVLSHDLIEGCHARSGLISDVTLVEEQPMRYLVDAARRSRWVRGDWQLLPWLRGRVPAAGGASANPLDRLSRWKIADNLRRSLVAPASFALLAAAWLFAPYQAAMVVTAGVAACAMIGLAIALLGAVAPLGDQSLRHRMQGTLSSLVRAIIQAGFDLAVLPFEAAQQTAAIVRTWWRMLISRRNLLEWVASADVERLARGDLQGTLRGMIAAPVCGVGAIVVLGFRPELAPAVLPLALAWISAPALAWWLSAPLRVDSGIGIEARRLFASSARLAWRYFEEHAAQAEHPLPPDNIQDEPIHAVAHRTSPTNIGLALLSELAAHDLGWQGTEAMLTRIDRMLSAVGRLERFRGHLYNWYDTRGGAPLPPRYISTVDSGNLAGHLLVLAAGLREVAVEGPSQQMRLDGVRVTLGCAGIDVERLAGLGLDGLAERAGNALVGAGEASAGLLRSAIAAIEAHRAELAHQVDDRRALARRAEDLAHRARILAEGMEWGFMVEPASGLLGIGWRVEESRLDRSCYDLLGSESRLGSYVAVALGALPQEHWFKLGRQQLPTASGPVLASWTGTMFEHLMPALVMPEDVGSLIGDSALNVVREQRRYADASGLPWGISESAYHLTDAQMNWQYRAFGVPTLGLKRGLDEDRVVAPYATFLAAIVEPSAAAANLRALGRYGTIGRYGYCEAIDFTAARLPPGRRFAVIRSWMAHHQGMTVLAALHVLCGGIMRRRFLADPRLRAHQLLLHERPPAMTPAKPLPVGPIPAARHHEEPGVRVVAQPHPSVPELHLVGNGRWHTVVTASGASFGSYDGIDLWRWRADPTAEPGGPLVYLRNAADGTAWSACGNRFGEAVEDYQALFSPGRAEFRRSHGRLSCQTEIAVSPEDDLELRRITLANRGESVLTVEITTYAEPVLAPHAADLAHAAFHSLFIETEAVESGEMLLAARRPRRQDEPRRWLGHAVLVRGAQPPGGLSFETDRDAFIGRGRDLTRPVALDGALGGNLAGGHGPVLDPCLAVRRLVEVPAGGRLVVDVLYATSPERLGVLGLLQRYRDVHLADRIMALAWTRAQALLGQLGANDELGQAFGRLAGPLLLPSAHVRQATAVRRNRRTRSGLWSYGISGDRPLVLLSVTDGRRLGLVSEILRAHSWWRAHGLLVDLVILVEDPSSYRQETSERVIGMIAAGPAAGQLDRDGGVFVRRIEQVPEEDRHLLAAYARFALTDAGGTLAQFAGRRLRQPVPPPPFTAVKGMRGDPALPPPVYDLAEWNGLGGFTRDGREYITVLPPGAVTPRPWCNILANAAFGSLISERGSSYTWVGNCQSSRLTPWSGDAVIDPTGEAIYLRDDDSGNCWCPTPGPMPTRSTRVVRHGFGYSAFIAGDESIESEMHVWVDGDRSVKFTRLRLTNRSRRHRRLSAAAFAAWCLGELPERTVQHVMSEERNGVLLAYNPMRDDDPRGAAFLACSLPLQSWTCDRSEFLGRGGTMADPAALAAARLQGRSGPALDACASLQVGLELPPGASREIIFVLGVAPDREQALALAGDCMRAGAAAQSLDAIYEHWKELLGRVTIATGRPELDLLANGWLAYQTIACRILARTGFSQSGGAWGFRDQLQDAMALVHHAPHLLREQILRSAARQFQEGDVQHWWHPPSGQGVRTRISDDRLWLPSAVARYVAATGDHAILDERQPFLLARELDQGQESIFESPPHGGDDGTIYEHCTRAILRSLTYGPHGLPLMGGGDWNDGMDRVGIHGRGESVWLALFLSDVLRSFSPLCRRRNDIALAERLEREAAVLAVQVDGEAWRGDRYLRAWMDDGTAIGEPGAPACAIDALPQAWAALSGVTDPQRARTAMASVERHLVLPDPGLVLLFDPPFDRAGPDPGYIKGYVPGVRENGGQYTHAAIWTAMAFAAIGRGRTALDLACMISPVARGRDIRRWMGEPYVMAADVYRTSRSVGRAGWTWYTGSAGWMLRLIVEDLCGLRRHGTELEFDPSPELVAGGLRAAYRQGKTTWRLSCAGAGRVTSLVVDGLPVAGRRLPLIEDGLEHLVEAQCQRG